MLTTVRSEIDFYLNKYEKNEGTSLDFYCPHKQLHPMAIAKYLLTLCSLYRTGLLSKANLALKAKKSLFQLDVLKIKFEKEYFFWGLAFHYNNLNSNEKYLITTAIVVQSLCELSEVLEDDSLNEMSYKSILSLEYWLVNKTVECDSFEHGIPRYSDHNTEPIYNPGAYAYSIIYKYSSNKNLKIIARQYMSELVAESIFGVGWTYSQNNGVIDLLHVAYVSNSLFSFPDLRHDKNIANIFSMLNQFNSGKYFIDAMTVKKYISEWEGGAFRYIDNQYFLELKSNQARMWSMGELLIVLSNILKSSDDKRYESICRKILLTTLNMEFNEKEYFRHTMHYTHGLSSFLEVLRSK